MTDFPRVRRSSVVKKNPGSVLETGPGVYRAMPDQGRRRRLRSGALDTGIGALAAVAIDVGVGGHRDTVGIGASAVVLGVTALVVAAEHLGGDVIGSAMRGSVVAASSGLRGGGGEGHGDRSDGDGESEDGFHEFDGVVD